MTNQEIKGIIKPFNRYCLCSKKIILRIALTSRFNHVQFAERSGDSYRWKGENTSANEVEKIIDSIEGVEKSAVFGVQLEKYDGKAGMAALVVENKSSLGQIYKVLKDNVQEASMPVFIRVV